MGVLYLVIGIVEGMGCCLEFVDGVIIFFGVV